MEVRILMRLALLMAPLLPVLACAGILLDLFPRPSYLDRPLVFLFLIGNIFMAWVLLAGMDRAEQRTPQLTKVGLNHPNALRYCGSLFVGSFFAGLLFALPILGTIQPKYWIGSVCFIFGLFGWLSGHLRAKHLDKLFTRDLTISKVNEIQTFILAYKAYYVDRRPLMILAFSVGSVGATVIYFLLANPQYVSAWDLAGFLFVQGTSAIACIQVGNRVERLMQLVDTHAAHQPT